MGLFRKSPQEDPLLNQLIVKLNHLDPRNWSVEDYEWCGGGRRLYTIDIESFRVWVSKEKRESKGDLFVWNSLSVWDGSRCLAKFTGKKVDKLYTKIVQKVGEYKKSTKEIEREREIARQREEEKARQASLDRLKRFL